MSSTVPAFLLKFQFLWDNRSVDLVCQGDVGLLVRVQEVKRVLDERGVEALLHQLHFLHLERSRHLQAGLRENRENFISIVLHAASENKLDF